MTNAVQTIPAEQGAPAAIPVASSPPANAVGAPDGWQELRGDPDIQFEEITLVPPDPPEPGWLAELLGAVLDFLASILAPVGQALGLSWPVLQWVLLALLAAFVLYLLARTFGPLAQRAKAARRARSEPEWAPDREESLALLEDADRLAAEGRFDEATHLLLIRSVGQIARARPDWVEPSSTARELAALPALSDKARGAFATIAERVERSLFALTALDRTDWEAARNAYADFALSRIEGGKA
jgi:hypothetical protein